MITKRHVLGLLLVSVVVVGARSPDQDAGTTWARCGVGTWVVHEFRESTGDSVEVYRIRTTLMRREDGHLYVQEVGRSPDTTYGSYAGPVWGIGMGDSPRDSVVGQRVLVLDGHPLPCRVIRTDFVDTPWCGNDPVDYTRSTSYRWESPDFHQFGGVVRRVAGPMATYYVDGHIESSPDSVEWEVVRLHERQYVGDRNYDCFVVRTINPMRERTSEPDTVISWLCRDVPWEVRSISVHHESGVVVKTEKTAVAYEIR